ncbi:MAG: LLM class flavin-dependent oxidoreductase [Actinomycetota bacterium]|nr:LLM class flavin-dependent oxidoreductase [Actinomycetota bacterium]
MNVGIGLPNAVPGTSGKTLLEWARRADESPFTSLGVLDRIAYDCHEPLTVLASAAAVTDRIRLATTVVIGPLRNTSLLATQAASINSASDGRLTLGLAVGARIEDYDAAAVSPRGRGERLTRQLVDLRMAWEGDSVGPSLAKAPQLLVGGASDVAFQRAARHADGYVHGGGPPRLFETAVEKARLAWEDAGRPGSPVIWGQGYFALGEDVAEAGRAYMLDYYAFTGPFAERIAEGLLTTPQSVNQFVRDYAEAGCDELVLFPAVSDPQQINRLSEVLT